MSIQPEAGATPDSMVLDRMQELEYAIASVKSSLDYHASSYYSVATQIAELNARIGRMKVGDKSSDFDIPPLETDHDAQPDDFCLGQSDDTATSIHASNAPVSVSKATAIEQSAASDCAEQDDQYSRIQQMINLLIQDADSALNSQPADVCHSQLHSDAQATPARSSRKPNSDYRKRPQSASRAVHSAPRSRSRGCDYSLRAPPAFRPSSALSTSRSSRRRSKPPSQPQAINDPAEADAESDSDVVTRCRPPRSHLRSFRPASARSRRKSSGHYSDWHPASRYRSDTIESCLSNSETCVSSGNRASREFELPSEHGGCMDVCTPTQPMHEFPCLDARNVRGSHRYGSGLENEQLRSVSALDVYRNERAAAYPYQHEAAHMRCFGRERSNTYSSEASPTKTYDFEDTAMINEPRYDELHGSGSVPHTWDHHMRRRVTSSGYREGYADACLQPTTQPRTHLSANVDERKRNERSLSLSSKDRWHQHTEVVATTQSHGLLNMVSLLYWTLLFTLGALMLDSFVCQVAGKRVMGAVDKISLEADMSDEDYENPNDTETRNKLAAKVGKFVRWYMEEPSSNHSRKL
ncbi:hypothetical protein EV183_002444 [Coemansia sp. RSA 2336]|nr:hypothetical protein EV183_002444 [Coemansia sp. RSA 2336]